MQHQTISGLRATAQRDIRDLFGTHVQIDRWTGQDALQACAQVRRFGQRFPAYRSAAEQVERDLSRLADRLLAHVERHH